MGIICVYYTIYHREPNVKVKRESKTKCIQIIKTQKSLDKLGTLDSCTQTEPPYANLRWFTLQLRSGWFTTSEFRVFEIRVEWRCGESNPGPSQSMKENLRRVVSVSFKTGCEERGRNHSCPIPYLNAPDGRPDIDSTDNSAHTSGCRIPRG